MLGLAVISIIEIVKFNIAKNPVNVQKCFYGIFHLSHSQNEVCIDITTEIRSIFDVFTGNIQNLTYLINNHTNTDISTILRYLYDNYACSISSFHSLHSKLDSQINHRNNLAPQIDHASDVMRCLWDAGYLEITHDFSDLHNLQAVLLTA